MSTTDGTFRRISDTPQTKTAQAYRAGVKPASSGEDRNESDIRTDGMGMEIVSPAAAADLYGEWQDLADRAAEPNPFMRPDFLLPIIAYLQPSDPRIVLIRKQGRLTGVIPVVKDKTGFGISGPRHAVYFHQYGPVGTPLVDRNHIDDTLSVLFSRRRKSDIPTGRGLSGKLPSGLLMHSDENGPVHQTLVRLANEKGLSPIKLDGFERACLDATQAPDHFRTHALVRKKRKDLSRLLRRMQEKGTVCTFAHRNAPEIAAAMERFIALEERSWKGKRETALGSEQQRTQLALDVVNDFALRNQMRIDEIIVAGSLVASLISFVDHDRLFTWKIAHDNEFARYSPGSQIILALSESLMADPSVALADSLATSNHPMINHLWRERLTIAKTYFPLRPQGPLMAACMRADERTYNFVHSSAKNLFTAAKTCLSKPR